MQIYWQWQKQFILMHIKQSVSLILAHPVYTADLDNEQSVVFSNNRNSQYSHSTADINNNRQQLTTYFTIVIIHITEQTRKSWLTILEMYIFTQTCNNYNTAWQGTAKYNFFDHSKTCRQSSATADTPCHRYCLFAMWQLYIGRPSVTKPLDTGGLSTFKSVKPNVRYVSRVVTLSLLRVVQMPCEPQTFNGGTIQASARLAMLTSPAALSFHWHSISIRRTDWQ